MNEYNKIYKDASGVDIEQQRRIWDERGKGYYGEFLAFSEIFSSISDTSKILMNLEIPVSNGNKTTEIDMLLVHETGIYSFEVKHYKGTIYGSVDGKVWTQYFKTTQNETFNNPVHQNEYHIAALSKLFPNVPIYNFVVFTNSECQLKLDGYKYNTVICTGGDLEFRLTNFSKSRSKVLDTEAINNIFLQLKPYSKLNYTDVDLNGTVMPLSDYVNSFRDIFNNAIEKETDILNKERDKLTKDNEKRKKTSNICIAIAIASIVIMTLGIIILPKRQINAIERKYADFFAKFDKVESITYEDVNVQALVDVQNLQMQTNPELNETTKISFRLANLGVDYGVGLSSDTCIIVQLNDGSIKEYTVFSNDAGGYLKDYAVLYRLHPGGFEFLDFFIDAIGIDDPNKIDYIKMNKLVFFRNINHNNNLLDNIELEIYPNN